MAGNITFTMIKPDAVANKHTGAILDKIIKAGFRISAMKLTRLTVTDRLTEEVLSIPVHPSLSDDEVAEVIGAVNAAAEELGPR